MKLLTRSDDYGFTRGVTLGCLDAIKYGFLRNMGIFTNMPEAEYAAAQIPNYPEACFGIDFNIVGGRSVANPKLIPNLVDDKGFFIRSSARFKDPKWQSEAGRRELFPKKEVEIELRAQYDRFIELTGHKPGYLCGHSISRWCEPYVEAIRDLAKETELIFVHDITPKFFNSIEANTGGASLTKNFDLQEQLAKDPAGVFWASREESLKHEYVIAVVHVGFVDAELFKYTSLVIERAMDHQFMTSQKIMDWIKENNVELITYRDCNHMKD